jgi:hypothetical protein
VKGESGTGHRVKLRIRFAGSVSEIERLSRAVTMNGRKFGVVTFGTTVDQSESDAGSHLMRNLNRTEDEEKSIGSSSQDKGLSAV